MEKIVGDQSKFDLDVLLITAMCDMTYVILYCTQETLITLAEIVHQSSRSVNGKFRHFENVWKMSEKCLKNVWIGEKCLKNVWIGQKCLNYVWIFIQTFCADSDTKMSEWNVWIMSENVWKQGCRLNYVWIMSEKRAPSELCLNFFSWNSDTKMSE